MRLLKMKNALAVGISAAAMFIATYSSSMCFSSHFEEVKMPESLIKRD